MDARAVKKSFYLTPLARVFALRRATGSERVDRQIIERARRGDAGALGELLESVAPRLLRLALRLSGDPVAAEEIVADALYRGSRRLGRLREPQAVVAWFRRITVNVWRDRLRRRKRLQTAGLDEIAEPVALPRDDPVERARVEETRERVRRSVDRLPPWQRVVLVLTVDEGMSPGEIADLLDTTPQRVKANLWHARTRLRGELGDLLGPRRKGTGDQRANDRAAGSVRSEGEDG